MDKVPPQWYQKMEEGIEDDSSLPAFYRNEFPFLVKARAELGGHSHEVVTPLLAIGNKTVCDAGSTVLYSFCFFFDGVNLVARGRLLRAQWFLFLMSASLPQGCRIYIVRESSSACLVGMSKMGLCAAFLVVSTGQS